jgi:hypothetical protein
VPANGVLSVFNYAANYPSDELRSACVLVHRPENANWARLSGRPGQSAEDAILAAGHPVKRLGLNLGAPGDHVAPDGTPWLRVVPSPSEPTTRAKARTTNALASVSPEGASPFSLHPAAVKAGERGFTWVAASGLIGMRELVVTLPGAAAYTVRLHFAEPDGVKPGQRVFSVALQGKEVLAGFDVAKEAGGCRRAIVREFKGIHLGGTLEVAFTPAANSLPPLLCGLEVIKE